MSRHSHGQEHSCSPRIIWQICKLQEQLLQAFPLFPKVRQWSNKVSHCNHHHVSYGRHSLYVMSDLLWTQNSPGQVAGEATVYWVLLLLAHPAEKDIRRRKFSPTSPGGTLEGKEGFNSKLHSCSFHFSSEFKSENTQHVRQLWVTQLSPQKSVTWEQYALMSLTT